MLVLIINNGSTSSRFSLIDMNDNTFLASGGAENLFTDKCYYKYSNNLQNKFSINRSFDSYEEVIEYTLKCLTEGEYSVISSLDDINAIGHRVVHGGGIYNDSVEIDEDVLENIRSFSNISPLHNTTSIKTIEACQKLVPNIPNIAVFDTTFHSTIPEENYLYAIPEKLYTEYRVRKYGFHGISYKYVLNRYSSLIGKNLNEINSVICHMGGGCSMTAIKNGKSYDTTMGFSPLSGMVMSNRSGNIDPAIIPIIMEAYDVNVEEAINILNKKSGYYAICGNNDAKSIVIDSNNGDELAMKCRIIAANDFRKNLLSMMANLPTIDSIVLTGGMLAKNYNQRALFFENLEKFGIILDKEKNELIYNREAIISKAESEIPIYVIPTNEELQIAKECIEVLSKKGMILRKTLR